VPPLCAAQVFDFGALKQFLSRKDFKMVFDAMHAVTGPYAQRILVQVGKPLTHLSVRAR